MKTCAFAFAFALLVVDDSALAQSRRFAAGRVISREVRITSDCTAPGTLPGNVSYGSGLTVPIPSLPPCRVTQYNDGTSTQPRVTFSRFAVDAPDMTPAGTLNIATNNTANIRFDTPLTVGLSTTGSWSITPPQGVAATIASSYSAGVQFAAGGATCSSNRTATGPSGTMSWLEGCAIPSLNGTWDPASQTASFTVYAGTGFTFVNVDQSIAASIFVTYRISWLEIDHIEVGQSVQTAQNTVPLVAGKDALVRVFPVSSSPDPGMRVRVKLSMFRDDKLERSWESGYIPVATTTPDRGNLEKSANFRIPPELTGAGAVRFDAEILTGTVSAGKWSQPADFQRPPGWPSNYQILFVKLCDDPSLTCASDVRFNAGNPGLVPFLEFSPIVNSTFSAFGIQIKDPSPASVFRKLFLIRYVWESSLPDPLWAEQYVAFNNSGGSINLSDPVFSAGFKKLSYVSSLRPLGCVFGQNLGLTAVEGSTGEFGYSFIGRKLFPPETDEFMSCREGSTDNWISPDNFIQLFNAYRSRGTSSAAKAPAADPVAYTLLSGVIDGNSATLDPPARILSVSTARPSAGDACFSFLNASSSAPTRDPYCFENATGPFAVQVVIPEETARIILRGGSQELASIAKSANAPIIQFPAPQAGAGRFIRVQWTASDADGDTLRHQLWGSIDGGQTWLPISMDLTAPELLLDTAAFPESSSIRLQARVSDGFSEAIAEVGPVVFGGAPVLERPDPITVPDSRVNEGRTILIPLRNTGAGGLQVTAFESSLPAFTLATALPFRAGAEQTKVLPITFSAAETGRFSGTLTLRTNDPASPVVTIPVAGAVFDQTGPAATLSGPAIDFGTVNPGSTSDQRVSVRNTGSATLNLSNITVSGPAALRLAGANSASIEPGAAADIIVRCAPASAAVSTGTLTANTNDATQPTISVALACTARTPAIEAPGAVVDFGTVSNGQTRNQQITVRNVTAEPINIAGASFSNSQFRLVTPSLPFVIGANASVALDVQFAPSVAGIATATLTLSPDGGAGPVVINLRGTGTGSTQSNGRLAVEPNQLVFGEVIVNQNRSLTLTIRNTGTGLLTVTKLESNNPAFTISGVNLPLAILNGAGVEAQIRFSPTTAASFNSVITIESDSITASELLVSMTGTGLPIPATTVSNLAVTLRPEWNARATIVSFGPDDANLRLVRFDSAGTLVLDTGLTIPPGAQLRPDIDSGSGWSQVRVSRGNVQGYLQYSAQQNQTFDVLPLSPVVATRLIMSGLERGSDIILNNLASADNTAALELRTNNGALAGSQNVTLGPRATLSQRVEQLFSTAPQGFQGYLNIIASQPIQATRTNHGPTAMEAIPALAAPAVSNRNVVLHAPRIQAGAGWLARLQVINPTDREARLVIRSASAQGTQLSPVQVTLPAGNAYWREYTQIYNLDGNISWNASLSVESNVAGIVAEVSYGSSFARGAFTLLETGSRNAVVPINSANTTFYVFNPSSTPTAVSFRNMLEDGSFGTGRRVTVPGGGYFGGPSGLPQAPAIRIESDQPVIGHASITSDTSDSAVDFGILPAIPLDGGAVVDPPGTSPRLQVDPASLDFGNVVIGQSKTLTLSIRNGGTAALTVNSIGSNNSRFALDGASLPLIILPGSTQQVQIRFTPTAPAGAQTGTMTVTSNDSLTGPVTINLNGAGTATENPRVQIQVSPTTLDYGDVNAGQTKDLQLSIRNGGTENLIVNGVSISNSRFQLVFASFPLTVIPSGLATIQIRFAPSAAGVQTGTLTVSSNDAANPSVNVSLRGNGVGSASSPRISVSVTSLAFGSVPVGQQAEPQTFEIRNTGTAPLVIQSMTLDNQFYRVDPQAPFTIAPNAISDAGVSFSPRNPGSQPATLRIISNDPANPTIVITITGAGQ